MIGEVHHLHWRELAEMVKAGPGMVDAVICDPPYSAAVHAGHGTMERHGTSTPPSYDGAERREIDYSCWDDDEVNAFVQTWSPLTRGWLCALSDDELGIRWKGALRRAGRLAFPLIPCTERGATVRLAGEGPSSCTTFLCVGRPRTEDAMRSAMALDYESHYTGARERKPVIGGKPLWLMSEIVRDYTKPADLVCDPTCGAGTTLAAAEILGRRWIGGDVMLEHADLARTRLAKGRARLLAEDAMPTDSPKALALFGDRT